MFSVFKYFYNDEGGAITVDFVVLTAAIVVLGLVVGVIVSSGAVGLSNDIEVSLDAQGEDTLSTTNTAINNGGG